VCRERWVVFVWEELRRAGHQHSSPRLRVLRALAGAERPVTAQELEDELRASTPVARGTIYQALELLDRHGFAYRLELGEGQARYLAADPRETPPHFLLCQRCKALLPLALDGVERAIRHEATRIGVVIDRRPLVLHGLCAPCTARSPDR